MQLPANCIGKFKFSYDIASEIEIMPCNKIYKPLVLYRFLGNNKVAYVMTKLRITPEIRFQSNLNVI